MGVVDVPAAARGVTSDRQDGDGAEPSRWTGSDASLFSWAASVVRNRCDILDLLDVQAGRLKRGDRTFASATWAFDTDFHVSHAVLGSLFRSLLCRTLAGERGRFATALETAGASAGPTERVTLHIRDGDRRVVEGRMNVRNAVGYVTANSFLLIRLCHRELSGGSVVGWNAGCFAMMCFCCRPLQLDRYLQTGARKGMVSHADGQSNRQRILSESPTSGDPSRPSCRPLSCEDLFGCERSSWFFDHARANRHGDASRDKP